MRSKTVHIVDSPPVRQSLLLLLETRGYQIRRHQLPSEFFGAVVPGTEGCVLVDVAMPEMSGIEFMARMNERHVKMPAIFITSGAEVRQAVEAMKAGTVDFLEKPYEDRAVLASIQHALVEEGRNLHRVLAGCENERAGQTVSERLSSLSGREKEVLAFLLMNKNIAHELGISPRTVEVHRASLMAKMKADSLAELVRISLRHVEEIAPGRRV